MAKAVSPLRYPGGKFCLRDTVAETLRLNNLQRHHYAEPYAGGCGLALSLLFGGFVSEIHVNDVDPLIWAFWHSILNETEHFIERIEKTEITVDEWRKQKEKVTDYEAHDTIDVGFATFFLNRTNRSGIIKNAGVIGGFAQNGNYKIDCRFNKEGLINRILRIKRYSNRIHLYKLDAIDFLSKAERSFPAKTFYCIDPPYYNKGSSLYTSFYEPEDHAQLADLSITLEQPWMITYDNVEPIRQLYKDMTQYEFNLNYSLQKKRVGKEIMIVADDLEVPQSIKEKKLYKYN